MVSPREIVWIGSSLDDLRAFPIAVRREVGHALRTVQNGGKPTNAKPMEGFKGASVLKIVEDFDGDTYRVVYTVQFAHAIYVLHSFQKKSKSGIATPKKEMDLVKHRYRAAAEDDKKWQK